MSEQNLSPDPKDKPAIDKTEEVIVVSRVTFNYLLVAVTFLTVGIVIGVFGLGNNQNKLNETQLRAVLVSVLQDSDLNLGGVVNDRFEMVDNDPYLGEEDAPIVIVEFSDFFCQFCKRHFDETFVPLLENYGEHIRYVYRDYAQLTPESQPAAIAAECANEQGAFWEFHNEFFNNQQTLNRDFYLATAEQYQLDMDDYTACLDENRYLEEVQIDLLDGQLEGVRGTPGFFINGQFISGAQPYVIFERVIQRELNQADIEYAVPEIVPDDGTDTEANLETTSTQNDETDASTNPDSEDTTESETSHDAGT